MELNLPKYLTFRRIINLIKAFTGYFISILLKKPFIWGMPVTVSIEPTNLCNLSCPECPSGTGKLTRPLGKMDFSQFKNIADEISSTCFYMQLFFQGEPLLNRELFKMIEYANRKKMYVSINTNGQLITEEIADIIIKNPPEKIIFSIDGITEEIYKQYRSGGNFEKVVTGIRLLSEKKKLNKMKLPLIEFQMIVMRQNEDSLQKAELFAKNSGADRIVFKSMQVQDINSAEKFLPLNREYSRYNINGGDLIIKNKLRNRCAGLWRTAVVTWDKRLVPCCFDKDAKYELGCMNGRNIKDIWFSDEYNLFRDTILNNRKSVDICTNCSEGMRSDIYAKTLR